MQHAQANGAALPASILADKQVANLLDSLAAAKASLTSSTSTWPRGGTGGTPSSSERSGSCAQPGDCGGTGTADRRLAGQGDSGGRRLASTPGRLYRIAYTFVGVEGDSSQLSLAAGDLVRIQCHDASGWTYGRLECASGGVKLPGVHRVGASGWFPEALLAVSSQESDGLEAEVRERASDRAEHGALRRSPSEKGCRLSPRSDSLSLPTKPRPVPSASSSTSKSTTPTRGIGSASAPLRSTDLEQTEHGKELSEAELVVQYAEKALAEVEEHLKRCRTPPAAVEAQNPSNSIGLRSACPKAVEEHPPTALVKARGTAAGSGSAIKAKGAPAARATVLEASSSRPAPSARSPTEASCSRAISADARTARRGNAGVAVNPRRATPPRLFGGGALQPRHGVGTALVSSKPEATPQGGRTASRSSSPSRSGFGRSITPLRASLVKDRFAQLETQRALPQQQLGARRSPASEVSRSPSQDSPHQWGGGNFAGFSSEEEMVSALEVLKSATLLQAKLAAMPDHVREPIKRQLTGLRDLLCAPDRGAA
mmetsp:Transcript_652/g.2036  ORF Transcript_652/g.2036 Transcript_652/m.2036 type:complete len:542 (-) Transcript_652:106-1731(-)